MNQFLNCTFPLSNQFPEFALLYIPHSMAEFCNFSFLYLSCLFFLFVLPSRRKQKNTYKQNSETTLSALFFFIIKMCQLERGRLGESQRRFFILSSLPHGSQCQRLGQAAGMKLELRKAPCGWQGPMVWVICCFPQHPKEQSDTLAPDLIF